MITLYKSIGDSCQKCGELPTAWLHWEFGTRIQNHSTCDRYKTNKPAFSNSPPFWTNLPFHEFPEIWNHELYLQLVPPNKPVRYLGIHITATLDWGPNIRCSCASSTPLLRQIKAGREIGLRKLRRPRWCVWGIREKAGLSKMGVSCWRLEQTRSLDLGVW
jgi:hypothetical protein